MKFLHFISFVLHAFRTSSQSDEFEDTSRRQRLLAISREINISKEFDAEVVYKILNEIMSE